MNRARLTKLLSEDWEKVGKEMGQDLLKMLDASEAHQFQVDALKARLEELEHQKQEFSTHLDNRHAILKEALAPITKEVVAAFEEIKESKPSRTKKYTVTLTFTREQLRVLAGLCREYGGQPAG